MALTLAQAKELSNNKLTNQIIDEFREDAILEAIPFDNTIKPQGKSFTYVYNRVTTLPTAAFRGINAEYTPQDAVTLQQVATLKIFGGSFNIDRVLAVGNEEEVIDLVQMELSQKAKAAKALFADAFVNGDAGSDVLEFDGIDVIVTGSSTEVNPTQINLSTSANVTSNGAAFMDEVDKFLSLLDGTPSGLLVNRSLMAIINGIARRSTYFSTSDVDAFGKPVTKYAGIPFMVCGDKPGTANPIIATTNGVTNLYAVRFGLDGVHAVSPAGSNIINTYVPNMAGAETTKLGAVEMLAAIAVKATRSAGVLRNIKIS